MSAGRATMRRRGSVRGSGAWSPTRLAMPTCSASSAVNNCDGRSTALGSDRDPDEVAVVLLFWLLAHLPPRNSDRWPVRRTSFEPSVETERATRFCEARDCSEQRERDPDTGEPLVRMGRHRLAVCGGSRRVFTHHQDPVYARCSLAWRYGGVIKPLQVTSHPQDKRSKNCRRTDVLLERATACARWSAPGHSSGALLAFPDAEGAVGAHPFALVGRYARWTHPRR